jgi:thioesterase domain-containing protein
VYDGRVLLFWARCRPLLHSLDPALGWNHHASSFERVVIACNHDNILKAPHVATVAAALERAMNGREHAQAHERRIDSVRITSPQAVRGN